MDELPWWIFRMPESLVHVPAASEEAARAVLVANSYRDAPVASWPLVSTRVATRSALAASLTRSR